MEDKDRKLKVSSLDMLHITRELDIIKSKLTDMVTAPKDKSKTHFRINCTFKFKPEMSTKDIAENLLLRMEHNECGVEGKIVNSKGKYKCKLFFPFYKGNKGIRKEFVFESIFDFIPKLIANGVSELTIAQNAAEVCDNMEIKTQMHA